MPDLKTSPEDLACWMKDQFGATDVQLVDIEKTGDFLFRIHDRPRSPFPELVVTLEALEDWDIMIITGDFISAGLVERLKQNPSPRLRYGNERSIISL